MLQVVVYINGIPITRRTATRLEKFKGKDEVHTYVDDEGNPIFHKYSDGAEKLAVKLLRRKRKQRRRKLKP